MFAGSASVYEARRCLFASCPSMTPAELTAFLDTGCLRAPDRTAQGALADATSAWCREKLTGAASISSGGGDSCRRAPELCSTRSTPKPVAGHRERRTRR